MKKNYKTTNYKYWQKGYYAPSVEPAVFRFYGKFLKHIKKKKIKLLDFGCGQGAGVNFFNDKKINAFGVDISLKDINEAKKNYKKIKKKFTHIKNIEDFKTKNFDVVTCIQSLYYMTNQDIQKKLNYFENILNKDGIIYATMISTKSSMFKNKKKINGMSLVTRDNKFKYRKHYINFTRSYSHLQKIFKKFKILNMGYYSFCLDRENDMNHHFTIIAQKK